MEPQAGSRASGSSSQQRDLPNRFVRLFSSTKRFQHPMHALRKGIEILPGQTLRFSADLLSKCLYGDARRVGSEKGSQILLHLLGNIHRTIINTRPKNPTVA